MTTLADLRAVTREIHRRATRARLRVLYSEDAETAYATKDSIVLPVLKQPVTPEQLLLHRYRALHEVGHHDRFEAFELMEKVNKCTGTTPQAHWCWNLVEDEAQEAETQARWPGDRITLERGRGLHVHGMLVEVSKHREGGETPSDDTVKQMAAYTMALRSRRWHRGIEGLVEAQVDVCGPEAAALSSELEAEGWSDRIAAGGTVSEVYELARELHARLWPEQEQMPNEEEVQQNAEGKGEENQEDGGESEGKAQQNPGDGDPSSEELKGEGKFTIDWSKLLASDHSKMDSDDPRGELHITYSAIDAGGVEFFPDERVNVDSAPENEGYGVAEGDRALGNQLRRFVQSTNRATWESERRSGRINKRALKRIVMGTEDRHRRVFQRRTDATAINTAITLLVDCSGSMAMCGRIKQAAEAAATLVDAFAKALRIPVEVLGHTETGRVKVYVAKSFNEHVEGTEVAGRLLSISRAGNADGDALMVAAERLAKRSEKRRIIIMLADGQPTDAWEGADAAQVLRVAVSEVGKMGLELYGIGLGYTELGQFIPNSTFIRDREPVTPVLLEACQKFVLKN